VGRACTVCAHPEVGAIDRSLVEGAPNRRVASRHGVTERAVRNHKANHLPAALAKAKEAGEIANAGDLLDQVRGLHGRTLAVLAASEDAGDLRTALAAIGEARRNLELLAKLVGELDEAPRVSVLVSAEWVAVRTALLRALTPHAEARAAAAAVLLGLEGRGR
jgi:hypothetical protein